MSVGAEAHLIVKSCNLCNRSFFYHRPQACRANYNGWGNLIPICVRDVLLQLLLALIRAHIPCLFLAHKESFNATPSSKKNVKKLSSK